MLDLNQQIAWFTFESAGPDILTSRRLSAVASLSRSKIAILGGVSGRETQRDIFIVDIDERSTRLMRSDCGKDFFSRSSAVRTEEGSIASLVQDHEGILYLVTYNEATNTLTT